MSAPKEGKCMTYQHNVPKKIRITVHKVTRHETRGVCHCHTEGEVFTCDFERCPGDICAAAWHSLWAQLRTVELGGRHPWDAQEGVTYVGCPDPNKPVVFKIEAYGEAD